MLTEKQNQTEDKMLKTDFLQRSIAVGDKRLLYRARLNSKYNQKMWEFHSQGASWEKEALVDGKFLRADISLGEFWLKADQDGHIS
jgi:hypothetical protein